MRWLLGLVVVVVAIGIAVLVLLKRPAPIDPVSWTPDPNPGLTGAFSPNNKLASVERLFEGKIAGPEAILCSEDTSVFAGLEDGRIVQLMLDGKVREVANTGGRPLGLARDVTGNLIVADARRGLLSVTMLGEVDVVSDFVDGTKIGFADDVAIASDGTIWFSDASANYGYQEVIYDFLEGRPSGRLLSYDPATGETSVRMDQLWFANGVALGPNDAYVLVTETPAGRINRLWLKGDKAGQRDVFLSNLPGTPDNITFNGSDTFWIAMPSLRAPLDATAQRPWLRRLLSHLPIDVLNENTEAYPFVIAVGLDGKLKQNLQNTGEGYNMITSATECNGHLYLGSVTQPALARIPLQALAKE